ncbi:MAG: phytanoyl-CoA dioxygenase family protein [Alphaproteobacteria bacterium]|nr:phytanoyl-CoA dioxygenase family protein [Alphaproteobacteria bacterium]
MPKLLSEPAIRQYQESGFHFPVPVLSTGEAADLRRRYEAFEASQGGTVPPPLRRKLHLLLTWFGDLVRHPRILDAVEDLLGPDLLCWQTSFFIKGPGDGTYVSWHQDSTYWGLSSLDVATAWVALTPATVANGCMRMLPGSHLAPQAPHKDTFEPKNLLSRGQEIAVAVDERQAVDVALRPGEMSLHHVRMAHASPPNGSADRRIGVAIRYIAAHVSQSTGLPDSATLVRGRDSHGHFELEPRPQADMHPDALALHRRVIAMSEGVLFRGGGRPAAE